MIEVRKISEHAKFKHSNMDYVVIINGKKKYFTKNAILELRTKLNKLNITGGE